MQYEIIYTDIDPRFDRESIRNRIGDFLDHMDPSDRPTIILQFKDKELQ